MSGRRVRQGGAGLLERPAEMPSGPEVYSPSRKDPVARAATTLIGGQAGKRLASATGFWRAAPILVLLACATLSLGVVQKQHCRARGWSSPDQFWHACYSDIPVLYGSSSLGAHPRPGLVQSLTQGGLGQPPLAGALMWITAAFVPNNGSTAGRQYFDLSVVLLAFLLAIAVAALAFTAGRRSWDAAHLALSPVLITAGLISYELLAVALTALALYALARGRAALGGVFLGLAIAAAPQLAVLAVVVALLSGRSLRSRAGLAFGGSALGAWFAVRVLLLPGWTGGLGAAFRGWQHAVPGYGSIWLIPQLLGSSGPKPATSWSGRVLQLLFGWLFKVGALTSTRASILAVLLFVVLAMAVLTFTVLADESRLADDSRPVGDSRSADDSRMADDLAPSDDALRSDDTAAANVGTVPDGFSDFVTTRVAPLGLAALAVVLLCAKSVPVQASLLLLPLIALSGLRWRDHLIWAAAELVYFIGIWLYIGGETTPNRGLPPAFYLTMLVARLAGIAWVGVQGVLMFRDPGRACGQTSDGTPACGQISSPVVGEGSLLTGRGASAPQHAG